MAGISTNWLISSGEKSYNPYKILHERTMTKSDKRPNYMKKGIRKLYDNSSKLLVDQASSISLCFYVPSDLMVKAVTSLKIYPVALQSHINCTSILLVKLKSKTPLCMTLSC